MKATLLVLAMLTAYSPSLLAQTPVRTGDRLRIDAAYVPEQMSVGEFADSTPPQAALIPLHSVRELTIRQSRTPLQGATRAGGIGLLIGGGAGVLAGLAAGTDDCDRPGMACVVNSVVSAAAPVFMGILGASAGAFIGAVIGSVHPGEHVVRFPVPLPTESARQRERARR